MDDLLALFGTAEPPALARTLRAGPLSADLVSGNLRTIRFGGREVLRAISYVVRDRDWGTLDPAIANLVVEAEPDGFAVRYDASCHAPDGTRLAMQAQIRGTAAGSLHFRVEAVPEGDFETNRCGFCVLHPIEGVAGAPVEVLHGDGSREASRFPDLIEPWQPFQDIRALTHEPVPGLRATCRLEGDTFEMEDQRAWSDASFKTYVRPLALPWPYRMPAGETNRQSVALAIEGVAPPLSTETRAGPVAVAPGDPTGEPMPRVGVALAPDECADTLAHLAELRDLAPRFLLFSFDPGAGHDGRALASFARIAAACPEAERVLEFAVPTDRPLDAAFAALAEGVREAGLDVETLIAGPDVDRQSTPPGSRWPDCPPLDAVYAAARRAFPAARLGGGMLSYFTELNRKRVPTDALDLVTHATCPIVHAADDLSVMQTLEAVPFVTRSARAIIGDKPYRLGPTTIGMRQNPYGSRTMPNPDRRRIAMAADDPRARGLFGAAFLAGYAARLDGAGVEAWCASSFAGPRGLFDHAGRPTALAGVLKGLARASGRRRIALRSEDRARVDGFAFMDRDGRAEVWLANLTAEPQDVRLEGPFELRDRWCLPETVRLGDGTLELGALAVARLARPGPRQAP
ncbi:D-apionate lactonase [Aureimonas jatrophae]|uniref:Uncharacterized protein n=1 Tax=Aureimonas jatrophae TaxID=1166073 RepID=A0A1H0C2Z1_9HYPH|nr:hypothetical protein [Aureimonas jatrophae]MBB3949044.1 hypothetical protein [Aureimonas jatrophae]SDN52223.1 hypothetical protein SAMN05192530_101113 [Aureimonas jatrophae]